MENPTGAIEPRGGDAAGTRRTPTQKRSRERVERMLAAATELIAERGSDALRMSEVAERAGVSIGSLYQFFPDKTAIVGTLVERYNEAGRRCIADGLAQVESDGDMRRAFCALIDIYYRIFLAEPVMRDIWFGAQADKALRDAQLADSRRNGAIVAEALKRLRPLADPAALEVSALAVMHLGEEAMRLAISIGRQEGDALVEAYKRMALAELLRG
ncbi:TetR/AcrR family transcriptional regulator [Mesorhizobium sp. LHD-90]|uniref:TetR/AcrR family transcriptional regulator n=1 Tax=Mesorhizobium sp. LHD-90 TaxID=3071414 RepID=UPI0027E169DA|nr:TetR/AcrR family transcriptional regulator [Mesorhizobium sp. LHD-90]MDQ6435496.1 TetR/AcrR family transcriptional regulator [Mesorhizobium sp. LHD-90]